MTDAYCYFEGMTWPCPGERLVELERRLRGYDVGGNDASLTTQDRLVLASVVSAYTQLVMGPTKHRAHRLSQVRMVATKKAGGGRESGSSND